jgi:hypothetical protein
MYYMMLIRVRVLGPDLHKWPARDDREHERQGHEAQAHHPQREVILHEPPDDSTNMSVHAGERYDSLLMPVKAFKYLVDENIEPFVTFINSVTHGPECEILSHECGMKLLEGSRIAAPRQ